MLCAELERLEAEFDRIVAGLEDPDLQAQERKALQQEYDRMLQTIADHRRYGHDGKPCYEEEAEAA